MSAWGLARQQQALQSLSGNDNGNDDAKRQLAGYIDRVVRWIPADVVAFYALVVTALRQGSTSPNVPWLMIFAIGTPLIVILGAFSLGRPLLWSDLCDAALSLPAFLIWSISIPESGWWKWSAVSNNPAVAAVAAGLCGLVFSLLAQGIEKRASPRPIRARTPPASSRKP